MPRPCSSLQKHIPLFGVFDDDVMMFMMKAMAYDSEHFYSISSSEPLYVWNNLQVYILTLI